MGAIESEWAGPELMLTLCEDLERAAAWAGPSCQIDHVVRGGSQGEAHVEEHEDGCGGCPYATVAYVRGTASGPALGANVPIRGEVRLAAEGDDDPYAFPWTIDLACEDDTTSCAITGSIRADGTVSATVVVGASGPGRAETRHALSRTRPAACE